MLAPYRTGQSALDDDPRRVRSRARLIEAATTLLAAGGVQAVTIDAVTRTSRVARSTLYRHFDNSTELLVAAFEQLLPRVERPAATGSLQERVTELVTSQALLIDAMPIQLTALAWLAMGSTAQQATAPDHDKGDGSLGPLREHVVDRYRAPFDEILGSAEARAELGDLDIDLSISQLVGPVVFARLSGLAPLGREGCAQIVKDFFAARRAAN